MDQGTVVIVGASAVTIVFGALLFFFLSKFSRENVPYQQAALLSPAEWVFFFALLRIIPNRYSVFAQVCLAAIVKMPEDAFIWRYFNALGAKSVDYVVWDKIDKKTVMVIELDDKTHLREDRKRRDTYVDQVLKHAGIPILHQVAKAKYDEDALKQAMFQTLHTADKQE